MEFEVKYLTREELERLFGTVEKSGNKHWLRDLCIFRTAYLCGLRPSEARAIKVSDYDSVNNKLCIERSYRYRYDIIELDYETGKNIKEYIEKYKLTSEDFLFKTQKNKPISRQYLNLLVKKYCGKANIKDVKRWHFEIFRKSRAVHLAEMGISSKKLKGYIGCENSYIVLKYYAAKNLKV